MKKLFLLLAMAGIMVACGGNDEKKDEKGGAATVENMDTTLDKLAASLEDDTPDNFIKIYKEMDKAYENASEADKKALTKAREDWAKKNPEKFENIGQAINFLMEEGLL
jgi:hypothetical protein